MPSPDTRFSVVPLGLLVGVKLWSRGLHPWLLAVAPVGAALMVSLQGFIYACSVRAAFIYTCSVRAIRVTPEVARLAV